MTNEVTKKVKKALYGAITLITALGMIIIPAPPIATPQAQAAGNSMIGLTNLNVEIANNSRGATTTYTFSVESGAVIPDHSFMNINAYYQGGPGGEENTINFSNAVFASGDVTGANGYKEMGHFGIELENAGVDAFEFTLAGLRNPNAEGPYGIEVSIYRPGEDPGPGDRGRGTVIAIGTPSVQGTVKLADNSLLDEGYVEIMKTDNFEQRYGSGISGGMYMIFGAATGIYNINVYTNAENVVGQIPPQGERVTVIAGETAVKNLRFDWAVKYIRGEVRRKNGDPVTDAVVRAFNNQNGTGVEAETNDNGRYALAAGPGNWNMNIEGERDEHGQPIPVNWMYAQEGERKVTFANNSTPENITENFTVLTTNARVTGKVVYPNDRPATEGWLNFRNETMHMGVGGPVDQRGNFNIPLMAGTYTKEFHSQSGKYYLDDNKFTVGEETKNLGTLTLLEKNARVNGRVVRPADGSEAGMKSGNGVGGVEINCWSRYGGGFGHGVTNDEGYFSILMMPFIGECSPWTEKGNNDWVYMGMPKGVNVGRNDTANIGTFSMTRANAQIEITLINGLTDEPLTDLFGYAYLNSGTGFLGSPLNRGSATIKVPAGRYNYGVDVKNDQFSVQQDKTSVVTVAENKTAEVTVAALPNNALIRGFVKDEEGKVIKGLDGFVFVDADGSWRNTPINSQDGSYSLGVVGGPFSRFFIGSEIRSEEYMNVQPFGKEPVQVSANETYNYDIILYHADATIEARVLDPDGNLIPHGYVWASTRKFVLENEEEETAFLETGSDAIGGVARFGVASSRTYMVGVGMGPELSSVYLPPKAVEVTPKTGERIQLTLQLEKPDAIISGRVTTSDGNALQGAGIFGFTEDGQNTFMPTFGENTYQLAVKSGNDPWLVGADGKGSGGESGASIIGEGGNFFYRAYPEAVSVPTAGEYTHDIVLTKASFTVPEAVTETFAVTDPHTIMIGGGSKIFIPAGALGSAGNVTVTVTPSTHSIWQTGMSPVAFSFDIKAYAEDGNPISKLNSPVSVVFQITEAMLLEAGVDNIKDLVGGSFNEATNLWDAIGTVAFDEVLKTVTITVDHFSVFSPLVVNNDQGLTIPDNIITGAGVGGGPQVSVYDQDVSGALTRFFAYDENARFGVNVASGDLQGDGTTEIVTGPGEGGGPQVKIFTKDGVLQNQFMAYDPSSRFGVRVAVGDTNGDGSAEIVTMPGKGAPAHAKVWNHSGQMLASFFAYPETGRGSGYMTLGDANGDGKDEIFVGSGGNGQMPAQVRVFNENTELVGVWQAYDDASNNTGVTVALGDLNGDGKPELVTGTATGKGPHVKSWDPLTARLLSSFMAFDPGARFGVNVAVGDTNNDGHAEIIAAPGQGGGTHVKSFDEGANLLASFFPYARHLRSGVNLSTGGLQ